MRWQLDLSSSYNDIGNVLADQGKLDEALTAYRDSIAIRKRLAVADPTNTWWQRDLSVSYSNIGDVLVSQGKLDEALTVYRDSLAIGKRVAAADPSNVRWQNELQNTIGRVDKLAFKFVWTGEFARALQAAEQAISLAPDKIYFYLNRAHALMFLGRVNEARALYLRYTNEKNVQDSKPWETVVLEDFAELRKEGLTRPLMDEIERRFATTGLRRGPVR